MKRARTTKRIEKAKAHTTWDFILGMKCPAARRELRDPDGKNDDNGCGGADGDGGYDGRHFVSCSLGTRFSVKELTAGTHVQLRDSLFSVRRRMN